MDRSRALKQIQARLQPPHAVHEEGGVNELTLEKFSELGLLRKKNGLVKVLGSGEITTAITVHAHKFSKSAQEKIEKAGGTAEVVAE